MKISSLDKNDRRKPIPNNRKNISYIIQQCSVLVKIITSKHKKLITELRNYESFETATDEIERTLDCLRNISNELQWLDCGKKINLLCTIIPINLPLYSLIIFAVIPGFMANEVIIRPPVLARNILHTISELIELQKLLPHIKFVHLERNLFGEAYISVADVIIFTGRYENAKLMQKICSNKALFIYDGNGINQIIVTDSAKLDNAIQKIIKTRIFNSGQDCAGPDIIFVHEKSLKDFKNKLIKQIDKIKIGNYNNKNVRVGRLIKTDHLLMIDNFINKHKQFLEYGGHIDFKNGIVYPTVIVQKFNAVKDFTIIEFFAPVFYILTYSDKSDLEKYFSQKNYRDFAMYASIFGDVSATFEIPNTIILKNTIINEVEQGNTPYGGYGEKANFVTYNGITYNHPLLISKEICMYLCQTTKK